ncbi:DUF5047 domain-containing protein [Cellulosimicrobium cellulans]|uniref:DUF5047 domain-containing protein n=1 Tax=Cellulosimicrobium cellulans TaxID=1710 RepID=UPI0011874309|nr:DUF5047 domain-containing protein [Cellulosimicrobium cellulans]
MSDAYLDAIARPHQVVTRATVARGGVPLYGGRSLPVTGGSVTVRGRSIVRRTCDLVIAPRLPGAAFRDEPAYPATRTGAEPLGTDGQEITLRSGLVYAGGRTEWVPLGVFRIDDAAGSLLDRTGVQVSGVSRESWVVDDRFHSPRMLRGPSAVAIIRDLILESLPGADVAILTAADRRIPATVVDRDRWADGVQALAESIGCVVYADPTGRFVIADAPTLASSPVFRFQAGPGGILLDATGTTSRDPVYNAAVVTGDTPDGADAPVQGEAIDDRIGSPTRYGDPDSGGWGKKPHFRAVPSLTTRVQCERVARADVAQLTGVGTSLDLSSVPLFPLEGGDVVDVVTDHTSPITSISRHIIDELTIPLVAGGRFGATTRNLGEVAA